MEEKIRFLSKVTVTGNNTAYVHIDRNVVQRYGIKKGDMVELAITDIHKGEK